MPYNPGIQYRGDQYAFQGITGVGNDIAEGINKGVARYQQIQQQKAYGDTVMDHLAQTKDPNGQPYVPIDALNKYHSAGLSAQQGMVTAAQANFANDVQQQTQARQNALVSAQANYYQAHSNYMNARAGTEGADDNSPIKVDPVIDPASGKTTPGVGIIRKTGATINTNPAQGVQLDPTGKFFYDDKARTWKPLPAATMVLPGMGGAGNGAAPGPAGQPTPGQPGLPSNPGMTPGAPSLMPQAGGNPMLDQARAAIAGGAPKAAVMARLQQMGVDPSGL